MKKSTNHRASSPSPSPFHFASNSSNAPARTVPEMTGSSATPTRSYQVDTTALDGSTAESLQTQFKSTPRFFAGPKSATSSTSSVSKTSRVEVDQDNEQISFSPEHKRRRVLAILPHTPKRERSTEGGRSFKVPPRFSLTSSSLGTIPTTAAAVTVSKPVAQTGAHTFRPALLEETSFPALAHGEAQEEQQPPPPYLLSNIFSPRKNNKSGSSRFVKGGVAEQVRNWIIDASSPVASTRQYPQQRFSATSCADSEAASTKEEAEYIVIEDRFAQDSNDTSVAVAAAAGDNEAHHMLPRMGSGRDSGVLLAFVCHRRLAILRPAVRSGHGAVGKQARAHHGRTGRREAGEAGSQGEGAGIQRQRHEYGHIHGHIHGHIRKHWNGRHDRDGDSNRDGYRREYEQSSKQHSRQASLAQDNCTQPPEEEEEEQKQQSQRPQQQQEQKQRGQSQSCGEWQNSASRVNLLLLGDTPDFGIAISSLGGGSGGGGMEGASGPSHRRRPHDKSNSATDTDTTETEGAAAIAVATESRKPPPAPGIKVGSIIRFSRDALTWEMKLPRWCSLPVRPVLSQSQKDHTDSNSNNGNSKSSSSLDNGSNSSSSGQNEGPDERKKKENEKGMITARSAARSTAAAAVATVAGNEQEEHDDDNEQACEKWIICARGWHVAHQLDGD